MNQVWKQVLMNTCDLVCMEPIRGQCSRLINLIQIKSFTHISKQILQLAAGRLFNPEDFSVH